MDSALNNLLPVVSEEGNLLSKTSRIGSAQQANDLFLQLWQKDAKSRLERMKVQLVLDGYPPFDPEQLRLQGCADQANINIGMLKYYITEASRPLVDQINGVETFVNIVAKTNGDEDFTEWCSVVAEEHYRTVSKEPSFNFRVQELVRLYVTFGVAVPYFDDEFNWIWKSESLGDFLIPHDTDATEDAVDVAFMVRELMPSTLFNRYHNGNANWNKSAIKHSLDSACSRRYGERDDFAKWEVARKDNDLYWDKVIPSINVVHCWVRELDGKVSYFIFDRDAPKEFLFKREFLFDHQSQAFQFFTYGVGTTGKFHGIRGLGYDALPLDMEINRTMSAFIDALRVQGKMNIQADNEDSLQNLFMIEKGGFRIVPPGFQNFTFPTPNYAQSFMPGFNLLTSFLSQKVSSYSVEDSAGFTGGDARKTKAEVMARLQQMANASGGNAELFAKSWSKLVLEQLRRMLRKDYEETFPGGKQIKAFRERCKERGVPDSFWDKIDLDRCTVVPPVGAGSASQQITVLQQLIEFEDRGWLDLEGQERLHRAVITRIANKETANSLLGFAEIGRPTTDEKFASIENGIMSEGKEQPVWPNDNNQAHATIHVGSQEAPESIAHDVAVLGQAMAQGDEDTILRLAPVVQVKVDHTLIHVERMKNAAAAAQFREFLEQTQGFMVNVIRSADAIMKRRQQEAMRAAEEAGEQMQQAQPQGGFWGGANWGQTQAKLRENEAKTQQSLRYRAAEADQKLNINQQKAAQEMQIRDAKAANEIAIATAKAQAELNTRNS